MRIFEVAQRSGYIWTHKYASPFQHFRFGERDRRICPPRCRHNPRRHSLLLSEGGSNDAALFPAQSMATRVPKTRKKQIYRPQKFLNNIKKAAGIKKVVLESIHSMVQRVARFTINLFSSVFNCFLEELSYCIIFSVSICNRLDHHRLIGRQGFEICCNWQKHRGEKIGVFVSSDTVSAWVEPGWKKIA